MGCVVTCGWNTEGRSFRIVTEELLIKVCCGATTILVFVSFDDGARREDPALPDDRLDDPSSTPSVITDPPLVSARDRVQVPTPSCGGLFSLLESRPWGELCIAGHQNAWRSRLCCGVRTFHTTAGQDFVVRVGEDHDGYHGIR